MCLPNQLWTSFYKSTELIEFEHWFENWVREYFNPITNIIANDEFRKWEKVFKSTVYGTYLPSTNEDNNPCCCLYKQKHWLMNCPEFINKSLDEKKKFIVQNRLCWNCLPKKPFYSKLEFTLSL